MLLWLFSSFLLVVWFLGSKSLLLLGMVLYTWSSQHGGGRAGGSEVQGQHGLYSVFKASLSSIVCLLNTGLDSDSLPQKPDQILVYLPTGD